MGETLFPAPPAEAPLPLPPAPHPPVCPALPSHEGAPPPPSALIGVPVGIVHKVKPPGAPSGEPPLGPVVAFVPAAPIVIGQVVPEGIITFGSGDGDGPPGPCDDLRPPPPPPPEC